MLLFNSRRSLRTLLRPLHLLRPSKPLCNGGEPPNREFDSEHLPNDALLAYYPADADADEDRSPRHRFYEAVKLQADQIFAVLQRDGPGFNACSALDEMPLDFSPAVVREVLYRILHSTKAGNKPRCAKLAYKFFAWAGQRPGYNHTTTSYNLAMKVLAESDEIKAMWRLADEMTDRGLPTTARTFNILICTCGEAGLARRVVERFIKSKTFNYRPFKHSFNAILHSLLVMNQYQLVEWVYQKMRLEGHSPDVLTYNVVMCAKFRLSKLDEFYRLLEEMNNTGFAPDLHTFNLLLHVLGRGDNPAKAINILKYMADIGCHPRIIHFTTLIDGLSRANNLDACWYFFEEMRKHGCEPDVVCYTVMIMGHVVAGELEMAEQLFDEMIINGQLPNVFTYNSMIRGFCIAGRFDEACAMLKDMEARGCTPNFSVYSTLVGGLRSAGKYARANEIIGYMVEKGHYLHLLSKFKGYRRC